MSLRSRSASVAFALVLLGVGRTAFADPPPAAPGSGYAPSMGSWLADPRISNGQGFKAGDFELHPSLGAEIGADTNWFMRTDKQGFLNGPPGAPVQATPVMRITPNFAVTTASAQNKPGENVEPAKVNLQLSAGLTYNEFFGVLKPEQRNVGANVNGRVDFLPGRPFSVGLFALYTRTLNPSATGLTDFNRNDVGGGLELILQPGGGTLDWRLGYQVRGGLFDNSAVSPFNNVQNDIYTKGRWKFRPRTALLYDANFRFMTYMQQSSYNFLADGTPMRARLGIAGLVTSRVGLTGMLGWASTFLNTSGFNQAQPNPNPPPQWNSLVAQAEIKFFLTGNPEAGEQPAGGSFSTIALGYVRDYQTSFLSNFYGWDRGYLKWQWFIGPKAAISVEGGAGAAQYGDVYQRTGANTANLIRRGFVTVKPDAMVFGEYRILPSLGVNVSGRFTGEFSNETVQASGGTYAMDWKRFEAFAGVRWFM